MTGQDRGIFITIEGGEGCGKTTHSNKLQTHLKKKGLNVILTREPGGTPFGEKVREILLSTSACLETVTELMLFASDRMEHVRKVIRPALIGGGVVICDRFIDSTSAYQIGGRGLPEDLVRYLNMISSDGLIPDLTLLLDVPPDIGISRATGHKESDRFEREDHAFHGRVRQHYNRIAMEDPSRVKVIDSLGAFDEVHASVLSAVDEFLDERHYL